MTIPDLDAIGAREKAATPGPWHLDGLSILANTQISNDGPADGKWNRSVVCSVGAWGSGRPTDADAAFIAHARTDVPQLRATVIQLRDLVRGLIDPDPCWFDHHGGCQAHGYLSLAPGEKCPHQQAKEVLAELGSGGTDE
jgi:hypothetical protein